MHELKGGRLHLHEQAAYTSISLQSAQFYSGGQHDGRYGKQYTFRTVQTARLRW